MFDYKLTVSYPKGMIETKRAKALLNFVLNTEAVR